MAREPIRITLERARASLRRLTPDQAEQAGSDGALLIDVRTTEQIAADGAVPGAVRVALNVLEWRLDPEESVQLPEAGDFDRPIVVLCHEGYCSSLAAARLQNLGYVHATDVEGGFMAWRAHGLPITGSEPVTTPTINPRQSGAPA